MHRQLSGGLNYEATILQSSQLRRISLMLSLRIVGART